MVCGFGMIDELCGSTRYHVIMCFTGAHAKDGESFTGDFVIMTSSYLPKGTRNRFGVMDTVQNLSYVEDGDVESCALGLHSGNQHSLNVWSMFGCFGWRDE
jgi:hypothetical protein